MGWVIMADEPTLYEGDVDVNGWVAEAQRILAERGHASNDASGTFGSDTRRAVEEFQQEVGAKVDAIIGNQTWSYLMQRDPEPPGRNNEAFGNQGGGAGGGGGGDAGGGGEVPAEVVALGFPASWSEWTDEQKERYFGTTDQSGAPEGDPPESIEVAAIQGGDEGEATA